MAFFLRNRREDYFEEEEGQRSLRRKTRGVEEMGSGRKRRKKEPPKPWTKKERYIILAIILFTFLSSSLLALSARAWKLPGLPRLKLPDFQFSIFKSEKIILEKDNTNENEELKLKEEKIIQQFNDKTKELSGVYALYVIDLNSGYLFSVNGDEIFTAASLIKLPVMMGMYENAEDGIWNMEDEYILKNEDKISGSGSLYGRPAGTKLTYRQLVAYMGKESDNTAFNVAKKLLGEQRVKELIDEIGMENTNLIENETSPKDIAIFFQKLWEGELIETSNRDELLEFLTDTIYESWLADGLPEDIRIAHKYGRELHVLNDAGIVYTDNPYVIVIMSKGVVEREADNIIPDLSKTVYDNLMY